MLAEDCGFAVVDPRELVRFCRRNEKTVPRHPATPTPYQQPGALFDLGSVQAAWPWSWAMSMTAVTAPGRCRGRAD
jgi:hypothetical protein